MIGDVELALLLDLLYGGDDGVVAGTFAMSTVVTRTFLWPAQAAELRRDVLAVSGAHGGVWLTANLLAHRTAKRHVVHPNGLSRADLLPRARNLVLEVEGGDLSRATREMLKAQGAVLLRAGGAARSLVVISVDEARPHSLLLGWGGQVVRALGLPRVHGLHVSLPIPGSRQPDGLVWLDATGPVRRVSTEALDVLRGQSRPAAGWSS
jgi:hypothetical protein